MEVRILGAHQCETAHCKFTTILIDRVLAVDAGSLAGALTLDQQRAVRDVLITHQHWDHTKDLAGFGFNRFNARLEDRQVPPARIYCSAAVRQELVDRILAPGYWMDFFALPSPAEPTFTFHDVAPGASFDVGPYRVRSVPINHSVPTNGYLVLDSSGRSTYYTSDNGPGCGTAWATTEPRLLITECTYSNDAAANGIGERHGHLCPRQLRIELETFRRARGYLPRVAIVHVNPFYEKQVRVELADVAGELGSPIEVAKEGQTFDV